MVCVIVGYSPIFAQAPPVGPSGCVDAPGMPCPLQSSPSPEPSYSPSSSPSQAVEEINSIGWILLGIIVLGGIGAVVSKAVKSSKAKQSSSGGIGSNLQNSRTILRDYKSYSGPQYSQPSSPTRTTSNTSSIPELIKMDAGQSIEGTGITEGGPSFPKPSDVKLARQGNFTNINWNLPTQKDFEGRQLVGYEVYREIQRYSGADWITEREFLMDPNRTTFSWENVYAEKFYGVKALYRGQEGTLFSSIGVNPNYPNEV